MRNMLSIEKKNFTSGEAARICGLGLSTFKRWVKRGALRSYRTPGGDMRILQADLLDFMRKFEIPIIETTPSATESLVVFLKSDLLVCELETVLKAEFEHVTLFVSMSDIEFGYLVAMHQPGCVVLEAGLEGDRDLTARIGSVRALLAPKRVRMGVVGVGIGSSTIIPEADVQMNPVAHPDWARRLAGYLTGDARMCAGLIQREAV